MTTVDARGRDRLEREWPNFPRVDDPDLWEFRIGLYLHGSAEAGRGDFAAQVSEGWGEFHRHAFPYAWDEGQFPRWVYQAQLFEMATRDRRPWLSTFPYCSAAGDVDHLLPQCPSVQAAQRHGVKVVYGLGLLEVDGTDVCAWCQRVYKARAERELTRGER